MAETYAGWLTAPANTERRDTVGVLARAWKRTEGSRPKRSGIDGLTRWFIDGANLKIINEHSSRTLTAGEIAEAAHTAAGEYRRQRAAEALDLVPADAPPGTLPPVTAALTEQQAATGEILSTIYGQLSRIEGWLPLIDAKLDQALAWQATQDQRGVQLNALLDELRAAVAHDDAGELRDCEGRLASELPGEVMAWRSGMHMIHCRDDRCRGGAACDCPCHPWEAAQAASVPDPINPAAALTEAVYGQPVLPETVVPAAEPPAERGTLVTDAPVTPGAGWTYAGPVGGGGYLWTAPAGTPLPSAISTMPPGEVRDRAESAYRAVYPAQQADEPQPEPQQPAQAANGGLYGGHARTAP
jgi:hypothetical protein